MWEKKGKERNGTLFQCQICILYLLEHFFLQKVKFHFNEKQLDRKNE